MLLFLFFSLIKRIIQTRSSEGKIQTTTKMKKTLVSPEKTKKQQNTYITSNHTQELAFNWIDEQTFKVMLNTKIQEQVQVGPTYIQALLSFFS